MPALLNRRHNPLASRLAETELQLVSAKEAVLELEADVRRQTEHAAACEREAERCRAELHRLRVLCGEGGPAWERSERHQLIRLGTLGQQVQFLMLGCRRCGGSGCSVCDKAMVAGRVVETLARERMDALGAQ